MFSQACVISSAMWGGGMQCREGCAWQGGRVRARQPLKRVVRILLECILVEFECDFSRLLIVEASELIYSHVNDVTLIVGDSVYNPITGELNIGQTDPATTSPNNRLSDGRRLSGGGRARGTASRVPQRSNPSTSSCSYSNSDTSSCSYSNPSTSSCSQSCCCCAVSCSYCSCSYSDCCYDWSCSCGRFFFT